jgi:hypothetical protein
MARFAIISGSAPLVEAAGSAARSRPKSRSLPQVHGFQPGITARSCCTFNFLAIRDCIISIGVLHDGLYFCALQPSSPRRKAQNSVEVASAWLAPLLVLAITDEATGRPSCNSPTASGAHPTNGRGNRLWGQKRIQAELAKLGFKVSARTVAKSMRTARYDRGPSVRWRTFLKVHASNIWACDFFCVQNGFAVPRTDKF